MPITIKCPCGAQYKVRSDAAGRKMRCRECQTVFAVPAVASRADDFDDFDDVDDVDDYGEESDEFAAPRSRGGRTGSRRPKGKSQKQSSLILILAICGGVGLVAVVIVAGLLMRGVTAAREAARRSYRKNNLKLIALGMLNHEDVHRRFPGNGWTADGSHNGLSWRVHLLPLLEQQPLYEQFKLDEPWDSEHNKKLIPLMPDVYKVFGVEEEGKTSIHVFVGPGTAYGDHDGEEGGPKIRDIKDGLSNTIMTVEAGPDKAEIWTKPGGIPFDPAGDPLASLGSTPGDEILVGFFEGSAWFLPRTIDPKTLKLLIQHADGEPTPDF